MRTCGLLILGLLISISLTYAQVIPPKVDPNKVDKAKDPSKVEVPKAAPVDPAAKVEYPKEIQGKTPEAWVKELRAAKDPSVRENAVRILPSFGPAGRKAGSEAMLNSLTKDPDLNVRLATLNTIPSIGFEDAQMEAGLTAMIALLGSTNHIRYEATMALGNCGPIVKRAIPNIRSGLSEASSWQNRKAAAFALGRLGLPTNKDDGPDLVAVAALAQTARLDLAAPVRREAISSLLLLGPPVKEPEWKGLRTTLEFISKNDTDRAIQIWSLVAWIRTDLELIKPADPRLVTLAKFLSHADVGTRVEACQALGTVGPEAESKVPDLLAIVTSDKEDNVCVAMAIWAVSQIPSESKSSIPVLERVKANHKDADIKKAAGDAITAINKALTAPKKN